MADQSMLGEEDPGAALDLLYRGPEAVFTVPVLEPSPRANADLPSVGGAEVGTLPPAQGARLAVAT